MMKVERWKYIFRYLPKKKSNNVVMRFFIPGWVVYVFGIGGVCVGVVLVVAGVTGEIFWFSVCCLCDVQVV